MNINGASSAHPIANQAAAASQSAPETGADAANGTESQPPAHPVQGLPTSPAAPHNRLMQAVQGGTSLDVTRNFNLMKSVATYLTFQDQLSAATANKFLAEVATSARHELMQTLAQRPGRFTPELFPTRLEMTAMNIRPANFADLIRILPLPTGAEVAAGGLRDLAQKQVVLRNEAAAAPGQDAQPPHQINGHVHVGERNAAGQAHGFGILTDPDQPAVRYEGSFEGNRKHGFGFQQLTHGVVYEGQFENDLFHGRGSLQTPNGNHYEGDFQQGQPHGDGKSRAANGDTYDGRFENNRFHGEGTYRWTDGSRYEGSYAAGIQTGQGKLFDQNGRLAYEGGFNNDNFEGKGKWFSDAGRLMYEGDFANDQKNGQGKKIFAEGNYYQGGFVDDQMSGRGAEYHADGRVAFVGEFANDQRHGQGTEYYDDGGRFEGTYANDRRNGHGAEFDASGRVTYDGNWKDDVPHGTGVVVRDDNSRFEGEFVMGVKQGLGKEFDAAGKLVHEGRYENDVRAS